MAFILPLHLGCYFLFFFPLEFRWVSSTLQDLLLTTCEASIFERRTRARAGHVAGPVLLRFAGCFILAVSLAPQQQCRIPTASGGNLPGQCFWQLLLFLGWLSLGSVAGAPAPMQHICQGNVVYPSSFHLLFSRGFSFEFRLGSSRVCYVCYV